jgi:hypothetical protein
MVVLLALRSRMGGPSKFLHRLLQAQHLSKITPSQKDQFYHYVLAVMADR